MIIRAVSDSDSDDDLLSAAQAASAPRRSVFDPPDIGHASSSKNSAARVSWFAVCGVLVLLVLVDLAALFDPSPDVFALLPLLISTLFYNETIIMPPIASMLNQFVGLTLVGLWIYLREKSFGSSDSTQWLQSTRYGLWTVGALLCLGHVVSCLYLLFALLESNGDRNKFWLGRKHHKHSTGPYGRV